MAARNRRDMRELLVERALFLTNVADNIGSESLDNALIRLSNGPSQYQNPFISKSPQSNLNFDSHNVLDLRFVDTFRAKVYICGSLTESHFYESHSR
jgi:hypothetical protein